MSKSKSRWAVGRIDSDPRSMGEYNSSKTRVRPFFRDLLQSDPSGQTWLRGLLSLPQPPGSAQHARLPEPGTLQIGVCAWDDPPLKERLLSPPPALLRWLIENPPQHAPRDLQTRCPRKRGKRRDLLSGDARARSEALTLLDRPAAVVACTCDLQRDSCREDWHIFEGATHVDAYLETERLVILIEGKRTERGPTTHTSWMPVRHQMLRNLDDAWDRDDRRTVVGFFLIEGAHEDPLSVPAEWIRWSAETISDDALRASLPHRSHEEREQIGRAFLGVATWDAACHACGREPFNANPQREAGTNANGQTRAELPER